MTEPLDFQRQNLPNSVRLQKYLASCGLGSRRASEELIRQGRVSVDGEIICKQGVVVDPRTQSIQVDGYSIRPEPKAYLMFHKPTRVLCAMVDPLGRKTVADFLDKTKVRVHHVGRLDYDSEGLLLLTNDGDFAQMLTHPKHERPKTYQVWVRGSLSPHQQKQFRAGVCDQGEFLCAEKLKKLSSDGVLTCYEVVLNQGKNRQIRRMFSCVGGEVTRLKRVAIGGLNLGPLPLGRLRMLTAAERARLLK